ncbi:MAG TPA: hypothetical protein G4O02_17045, partial [Caldilineae bacterium]|nr:hypothetical protein [Caldilineae bacterium]
VEQLLHLIGDGYYGLFQEERHGEVLARYLDKAHRLGMRIIVYVNTHLIPPFMAEKDPEWAARHPDGSYRTAYDTYRLACPNSPWADWVMAELEKLARYEIDGVFSDGPSGACACDHCARAFEAWYGSPMPRGAQPGSPEAEALRRFDLETRVRFCRRFYETLKAIRPQAICYQNLDVLSLPSEPFLPYNDLLGSEGGFMFYGPPRRGYLWKTSLRAKVLEGCAQGRPTVIFAAGDQKPWSCYLHAPGETRLMFAASVANGASVWYGLHCPIENMNRPGGQAAGAMNQFLAQHEAIYDDTDSLANVALLHSASTRIHYQTAREASDFYEAAGTALARGVGDVAASFEGFAAMLYHSQIPFDVLPEEVCARGGWDRYRCLVAPTGACLSDAVIASLRDFVRGGGLLIASLDTSLFDEQGRRREDFGLADVFGACIEERIDHFRDFNYFEVIDSSHPAMRELAVRLAPAPAFGLRVRPTTARVLARYHAPLAGRYEPMTPLAGPAVLWNEFGQGHCLYLPGTFGEFYREYTTLEFRQIVAGAIRAFAPPSIQIMGAPPSLEVTLRRKRDGSMTMVHLVNYTGGMTRPIQQALPLRDLRIILREDVLAGRPQRARALVAGEELSITSTEEGTLVTLTDLSSEYEVLVIEEGR